MTLYHVLPSSSRDWKHNPLKLKSCVALINGRASLVTPETLEHKEGVSLHDVCASRLFERVFTSVLVSFV